MSDRRASSTPRSIEEIAARTAETDRRAEALGLDVQAARIAARAHRALRELLRDDDDRAREVLANLDGVDLERLEKAAVALSMHVSRLREAYAVLAALDREGT